MLVKNIGWGAVWFLNIYEGAKEKFLFYRLVVNSSKFSFYIHSRYVTLEFRGSFGSKVGLFGFVCEELVAFMAAKPSIAKLENDTQCCRVS